MTDNEEPVAGPPPKPENEWQRLIDEMSTACNQPPDGKASDGVWGTPKLRKLIKEKASDDV